MSGNTIGQILIWSGVAAVFFFCNRAESPKLSRMQVVEAFRKKKINILLALASFVLTTIGVFLTSLTSLIN